MALKAHTTHTHTRPHYTHTDTHGSSLVRSVCLYDQMHDCQPTLYTHTHTGARSQAGTGHFSLIFLALGPDVDQRCGSFSGPGRCHVGLPGARNSLSLHRTLFCPPAPLMYPPGHASPCVDRPGSRVLSLPTEGLKTPSSWPLLIHPSIIPRGQESGIDKNLTRCLNC